MSQKVPRRISRTEVKRSIDDGIKANDTIRVGGLNRLQQLRASKVNQQQREQNRLNAKYDSQHSRVVQGDLNLKANTNFVSALQMESTRAQTTVNKPNANSWGVQGHVYGRDGCALANADVALYSANGERVEAIEAVKTNSKGYYQLSFARTAKSTDTRAEILEQSGTSVLAQADGDAAAAGMVASSNAERVSEGLRINTNAEELSEGLRINTNVSKTVFVRANVADNADLCADSTLINPKGGSCSYRDLVLDTTAFKQTEAKDRRASRYLGNSATQELHDLKNEKKNCQIDGIRFDHVVNFNTQREAVAAGYDFCAQCFGKAKSKR